MAFQSSAWILAILGSLVDAVPTVVFPFNSQVPPVARISKPFTYTFSSSTFSSTLPLVYTLSSAPAWLLLDTATRTLSGIPNSGDAGLETVTGVNFGIVATDSTGSVTVNATIVISRNLPPIINIPISTQLSTFGTTSLPSTALVHPSTPFKFDLNPGTFQAESGPSNYTYYSVTSDNTLLPSWITFDQASFTFSGQTPDYAYLIQPPQVFGMKLIATDVPGFAGADISFDIKIGVHLFAFANSNLTANFTPRTVATFDGLGNNLQIDGQTAASNLIKSVMANNPDWLTFDNTTLSLSGTPPSDAIPRNITIMATNEYGDIATALVLIDITSAIFTAETRALNATAGTPFTYDLSLYVRTKSDVDMTVNLDDSISWLHFDPGTFLLSGAVPPDAVPSEHNVTIQVVLKSTKASSAQSFALAVLSMDPDTIIPTSASSPSQTTRTTSQSATGTSEATLNHPNSRMNKAAIFGIAVASFIGVLFSILLLILCFRRRKRNNNNLDEEAASEISVSAPLKKAPEVIEKKKRGAENLPTTLHLDTSGFRPDNRPSVYSGDPSRRSRATKTDNPLKRSRTYSQISSISGALTSVAGRSSTSGSRARAYSENAISNSDSASNWKIIQDSSYPIISSRANSTQSTSYMSNQRVARTYSNYSKKGHKRRSGRIWAIGMPIRRSMISTEFQDDPKINLKDDNFSAMPLANFTVILDRGGIPPRILAVKSPNPTPPITTSRRSSELMSPIVRTRSGFAHGSRDFIDFIMGRNPRRMSIGHGRTTSGLSRDSKTWLTVDPNEPEVCTRSSSSDVTETTDILQSRNSVYLTLATAPVSQQQPHCRPISWRIIDDTTFFSGRTESVTSRKSPNSETKAELDPELQAITGPESSGKSKSDVTTSQDSLGITYMSACEGTRQLRYIVQNYQMRKKTGASMKSALSKDRRFESANPSMQSIQQRQSDSEGDLEMRDVDDDEYDDFLPENCSDGSWETQNDSSPRRSTSAYCTRSLANVAINESLEYSGDSLAEVSTAAQVSATKAILVPTNLPLMGIAENGRIVRGRGRRSEESVDNEKDIGIVRGQLEIADRGILETIVVASDHM
ncbi:hypothetical protein BJ878DRAFT_480218 [Calycina marina]|uniref:Dystroglycan-type cadherin-like domain-containing protein n=1 Tax=Calycina marina TaxID=1763456 RepID=A0A9P7Z2Y1_9HELO|nr:hypothetical protein BJ878DRAFT_480218 [Calycina marina]